MKLQNFVPPGGTLLFLACLSACTAAPKDDGDDGASSGTGGVIAPAGASGQSSAAGSGGQAASVASGGTVATVGASGAPATGSGGAGNSAGSGGQPAGTGGQTGTGGAIAMGTGGAGADSNAACLESLQNCKMRDTKACSSFTTVDVGTLVKATELKYGPYGAIMEQNVGQGFEVPVDLSEANCPSVATLFGEPKDVTDDVSDLRDVNLSLYTVYRPACMKPEETYPVITWGNGTCGQTEGYGAMLRYIASYGYVIFASNSRYTANNGAMTKALDFAETVNADATSVYYKRLDFTKVGAMGHSQGGGATVTAARDDRVKAVIIWNATTSASKPFLAVSGDTDITNFTPGTMANDINASSQPSAWLYYHNVPQTGSVSGHLTLMTQPERVVKATTAWWDYMLKGDTTARDFFVGTSCGLCAKSPDYEYGQKGLE